MNLNLEDVPTLASVLFKDPIIAISIFLAIGFIALQAYLLGRSINRLRLADLIVEFFKYIRS